MSFCDCCNDPDFMNYSLRHEKRPPISSEMITLLVLYSPLDNTYHADDTFKALLETAVFDNRLYNLFLETMGIDPNSDILWLGEDDLLNYYNSYYNNVLCKNCSKLLLKEASNTSPKTKKVLNHLRNMVAHGRFNMQNGIFIGIDRLNSRSDAKFTAIYKINYEKLCNALKLIESPRIREHITAAAFEELGYSVQPETVELGLTADLIVRKDDKTYIIEFKETQNSYLSDNVVDQIIEQFAYTPTTENRTFVLVTPVSALKNEHKRKLADNAILLLDRNRLWKIFEGIDILTDLIQEGDY